MKHTIFISDLHLDENQREIFTLFLHFLENNAKPELTGALYILGDFFNWWAGDDDLSAFNLKVIEAIKDLVKQGIKVYLLSGNRDFLLGKKFADLSDCVLLNDPTVIELYGKRTLLAHGDILCAKDYLMKIFRILTRNWLFENLFLFFPLFLRRKIAGLTHRISLAARKKRNETAQRGKKEAISTIDERKVQKLLLRYNARQIIHGHIHSSGIFPIRLPLVGEKGAEIEDTGKRFVLNEWLKNRPSALFYYEDGSYELK